MLAVTAIASIVYSSLGGIKGTICTDFFLFATVIAGAIAVMYFGFARPEVGGFVALMQRPEVIAKLNFLPDFSDRETLLAVFIIPVAIQWWNVWYSGSEPGGGGYIVQRMMTAKTPDHALGGTLFAQVVQYAIRPWPWYLTAFASIVLFPDLDSIRAAFPGVDPKLVGDDMAYPAMIKFVPSGWLGIVAGSMMGALFSTIAAHLSMGANYVANDVWKRFVRTDAGDRELVLVARFTSILLMLGGCILAPMLASAKSAFDLMIQIGAGTGIIFLLRWFWMRINAWSEIVAMSVSFVCAVYFQLAGAPEMPSWQKLIVTMVVTTVAWIAATFLTKPENEELLDRFRATVRTPGRDIGNGVLLTFVVSIAIFAGMYFAGRLIYACVR